MKVQSDRPQAGSVAEGGGNASPGAVASLPSSRPRPTVASCVSVAVMPSVGEHRIKINGVAHWVRVAGQDGGRPPIVVVHGGPGGNSYLCEQTFGPRLASLPRSSTTTSVGVGGPRSRPH